MKISLTSVCVSDPLKAFEFYTKVLGFKEKMYMPEMRLAIVVSPEDPDGVSLMLEPNANFGAKEFYDSIYKSSVPVIVFGTCDIYAEYNRLKDLGVEFKGEVTKTDWGLQAIFDDTCGNYIMLSQQLIS